MKSLKERVLEEINKGIEEARREGVNVPRNVNDVTVIPIPIEDRDDERS